MNCKAYTKLSATEVEEAIVEIYETYTNINSVHITQVPGADLYSIFVIYSIAQEVTDELFKSRLSRYTEL